MLLVLVALAAAGAALLLYLRVERTGPSGVPLALLRATAWGLVAALLVNPGCRRSDESSTTVLLDASASLLDPAGNERWRAARDSSVAIAGSRGRVLLFGAHVRPLTDSARPSDAASRLLPAIRQAASFGGPIAIVTDGEIDDAGALPADLLGASRVIVLARPERTDAGIAGLDLPAALRSGDTATAIVDIAARGAGAGDSALLELLEAGRVVARARVPLGVGTARRPLTFVPATATATSQVRGYVARLTGFAGDGDPRNDSLATVASVSSASSVVILSDSPDYDARWLATTVGATSGLPVRSFVRLGEAGWRDARSLGVVSDATVREQAANAALLVVHGSPAAQDAFGRMGRGALWLWPVPQAESAGDWYAAAPEYASPVGAALSGIAPESLPPLESARELRADSTEWTALTVQLNRRGRGIPVIQGGRRNGRRLVTIGGSGLWRWAARGGVSLEAYRALVASTTDWLVESSGASLPAAVLARRDSLSRANHELLPREASLSASEGTRTAAATWTFPLRHSTWLYVVVLVALISEWVARRRMGLR